MKQIILFFTLIISSFIYGQLCGTPRPQNYSKNERTIRDRGYDKNSLQFSPSNCLNIYYHIIRETDGSGGFPDAQIETINENINEDFNQYNVYFFLLGYDFIDNSEYINLDNIQEANNLCNENNRTDALNVYIVDNLWNTSDEEPIVGSALNIPSINIVINKYYINSSVLIHEIGHCLNLLHTHETFYGIENIDGSNCNIAGDLICDTPADPGLLQNGQYLVDEDCNYIGGSNYNPDTKNIMSYTKIPCREHFTNEQIIRIKDAISTTPILQNITRNSCDAPSLKAENNEFTACNSDSNSTSIFIINAPPPYYWTTSSNITIIQNNDDNIIIKANTSESEYGTISCTFGNPSHTISKKVWLNKPFDLQSLSGPEVVNNNVVVSYIATPTYYQDTWTDGSFKYIWVLPYPYEIVMDGESPDYNNPNWWYFDQYGNQLQATTGTAGNDGYVQVWGVNKCGINVEIVKLKSCGLSMGLVVPE